MASKFVMLVVSVPTKHADALRKALGDAGAGKLGNYSHCSFSYSGTGRFLPGKDAEPAAGKRGKMSSVKEERIEMLCERKKMPQIIKALRAVHPYEEPAFHFIPIELG